MPAFVYLIPAIPFFGLGAVSAVFATVVFVMRPAIRLTSLGIRRVPTELIEAAKIDGASPFTILKKITIPLVMPSVTICLFLTLSNCFKLFDQNLALTDGAPSGGTSMLALDIYKTFYSRVGWEGVGQAKAVIFFLIVAALMLIQLKLTRKKEVEN